MRLTRVTLWNYRSYWTDDKDPKVLPSADISLAQGVNYIVGPNNVGKSNLLRAVALALDPKAQINPEIDLPAGRKTKFGVDLHFEAPSNPSRAVRDLIATIEKYEEKFQVPTELRTAAQGRIRLHVRFLYGQRSASLQYADVDPRKSLAKHRDALESFHEVVRFVDIHSGEDLNALLNRGFKEILANALGDEHSKAMKEADTAREQYHQALGRVLRPVGKYIEDRLRLYVPDVREVDPQAQLPPVRDALADAHFVIQDAVRTSLDQKGTGVRGAMLLLLMSFIADSSKSAIVFGIEEPEAFLHPDAHRQLGEGLERFTQRDDVSLLVTTHSPFLFKPEGKDLRNRIFVVCKDDEGRSAIEQDKKGKAKEDLLGSRALANLLDRAEEVPAKARMILLVEGDRDIDYLRLASQKLQISIDDVFIIPRGSGSSGALSAVTMAARHAPDKLVVALYDSDSNGKESYDILYKRFSWEKKSRDGLFALMYNRFLDDCGIPVEAEDLFTNDTLDAFLSNPVHKKSVQGSKLRTKTGAWHYDLDSDGKKALVAWLDANGNAETFKLWKPLLEHLRGLMANPPGKTK